MWIFNIRLYLVINIGHLTSVPICLICGSRSLNKNRTMNRKAGLNEFKAALAETDSITWKGEWDCFPKGTLALILQPWYYWKLIAYQPSWLEWMHHWNVTILSANYFWSLGIKSLRVLKLGYSECRWRQLSLLLVLQVYLISWRLSVDKILEPSVGRSVHSL